MNSAIRTIQVTRNNLTPKAPGEKKVSGSNNKFFNKIVRAIANIKNASNTTNFCEILDFIDQIKNIDGVYVQIAELNNNGNKMMRFTIRYSESEEVFDFKTDNFVLNAINRNMGLLEPQPACVLVN